MAKATDCKSVIVGSTPTGACHENPLETICFQGVFDFFDPLRGGASFLSRLAVFAGNITKECNPACNLIRRVVLDGNGIGGWLGVRCRVQHQAFWASERRQVLDGRVEVNQSRVRVPIHRQRDGRMPCQLLRDFRMNSRTGQQRDERMP